MHRWQWATEKIRMNAYDVIIVGGGMVGLACASLLKDSSLKVAVVDKSAIELEWEKTSFDNRVSAINPQSQNMFKSMGVEISELDKSDYVKMFVWDGESTSGKIEFKAEEIKNETLGAIVENRRSRAAIFKSCHAASNIDFYWQYQCESVVYKDDGAVLAMNNCNGERVSLNAKLMIAADGSRSWLREQSKIKTTIKEYQQKAIVCRVKTELPHNKTAYQRFDHYGPLAFLPLKNEHYCSIVWSVDDGYVKELMELSEQEFIERLTNTFESKLGAVLSVSQRFSFPLLEKTAETIIAPRLALVGDAAHAIHPLAGQGVNLGFADAKTLTEQILKSYQNDNDIGLLQNLRAYQRQRASDIWLMKKAMMSFKQLFGSKNPAIQMARSVALEKTNKIGWLKNAFVEKALGK